MSFDGFSRTLWQDEASYSQQHTRLIAKDDMAADSNFFSRASAKSFPSSGDLSDEKKFDSAAQLLGVGPTIYPQRPGQMDCDYYMKTGECKFGERCKFDHPIDRSASAPARPALAKLSLAGLPRREGAVNCPFYMKTGMCKYGAQCRFDHPPPGEVMAMATSQGTLMSGGGGSHL